MQTENSAYNSHKQFYIILNTNQIKLYTYPDLMKENPLLRKFLNSESKAYFLDETFYHTHIPLFWVTISAATVIKATKYSTYYIIHNYDITTSLCRSQRRCKYVSNETPNDVSVERRHDVSVIRLHDVLLEHLKRTTS